MARSPVLEPRTRTRRSSKEGGFTLIELLITVLVTVVALAGLFGVFTVTARGNAESRQAADGLSIVEALADEIKSFTIADIETDYALITTPAGWGPTAFVGVPSAYTSAAGVVFTRSVWARRIDDNLVWMKVAVDWTIDGAIPNSDNGAHDRRLSIEMIRSRTEGPPDDPP